MGMESVPTKDRPEQPPLGAGPTPDLRDGAAGLPPDAPQSVRDAARGHTVDSAGERSAVKYLLGKQAAPRYAVPVEFATNDGDVRMWFYVHSLDSKRIDKIEKTHTDDTTVMGESDNLAIAAQVCADALVTISDGKPGTPEYDAGSKTHPNDEDFREGLASGADALRTRFHWQEGLLTGVAQQVRRISGWAPDRVGQAERVLVDVAGGS